MTELQVKGINWHFITDRKYSHGGEVARWVGDIRAGCHAGQTQSWACRDSQNSLVHIYGKDKKKFYTLYWRYCLKVSKMKVFEIDLRKVHEAAEGSLESSGPTNGSAESQPAYTRKCIH